MNIEKLKRLQSQVRIGGKGTPRRKKKVMHQTAAADDKKLQSSLKKLSVSTIPGIEEVNIIKDDLTVIHFNNPKAQASLSANTFAVTGHGETKKIVEMLPEILPQLGQETVVQLRMFANSMTKNQKDGVDGFKPNLLGSTDEDDVPLLVNDFDEIAIKEDLNIGHMQRPTKGLVVNTDIINTRESAVIQPTQKYSNSENKATENATAVSFIEQISDDNVKMEVDVKKDNTKKSEKSDNTKKTTIPSNSGKEHANQKNKVTNLHPTPQHETICSIKEPLKTSEYNEEKDADVKEAVKKNTTKTVKQVNINKESSKTNNQVIDETPSSSQHTTADPLIEQLHTPDNNVKTDVNFQKDNIKKSEKNIIKKKTEPGYADIGNVKKESTKPKNKVTVAVASNTSDQLNEKERNECKKLLPKELQHEVMKTSNINIGSSLQAPTKQENVIVTEPKDNQPMISNAQPNKKQIEQQRFELNDQINLINSFDDSILLMDSNFGRLEISNKAMHKENLTILSFENNMRDSNVAVASTDSSCNHPEENVEKLKETTSAASKEAKSTCLNEELKKENKQEIEDICFSINTLEKTIKNVVEIKDGAHPGIDLLSLDSLKQQIKLDEKPHEIIANVITKKYDVQEDECNASLLNLDTKIDENQELQNLVIPSANLDANHSLKEKKADDQQLFDSVTVSFNQPDPLQTTNIQSEKMLATTLIDIEKQIKDVEITQDPTVSIQFVQENLLDTESLQNIKIQPSEVLILENAETMPQEVAKQNINDNIKPQIYADLTAKSTLPSPSQNTSDSNTIKPQLALPMKSDPKKPHPSVRPKQVSPPKSNTKLSLSTGTTPKTQQSSKSTTSRTSAKQEKSSVAPKAKQTLTTSVKSQAASKPSTTQPKKTSVYPPSSDSSQKINLANKASSTPETSQATALAKPRVDSNLQKGIKKTTVQQKISEDPPKPSQ